METLRTNTMLWVWEECLGFSKIQPDLNLSIVFCILTLSGALLRRCSDFDQLLTPVSYLLCTKQEFGLFLSPRKKKIPTKEVDRLYFQKQDFDCIIMARRCLFSCSLGRSREENFPFLVLWSSGSSYNGYGHIYIYTSHFMLSSDVMWCLWCHVMSSDALPNTWICVQTHPRQMQYFKC